MNISHRLHKAIGEGLLARLPPKWILLRDVACGGVNQISLFTAPVKSNKTKSCDVDMLIVREGKISMIIEIEETNLKPTQIYGKFFASAWSTHFIHPSFDNQPLQLDEPILFIQVLDTSKLNKLKAAKFQQFQTCSDLIKAFLTAANSPVRSYHLIPGKLSDIDPLINNLLSCINEFSPLV